MREVTLTKLVFGFCDWAVPDRWGEEFPHATRAFYRLSGLGEGYDGNYCRHHAVEAVLAVLNEERREWGAWNE
jgi:hypothetical protein